VIACLSRVRFPHGPDPFGLVCLGRKETEKEMEKIEHMKGSKEGEGRGFCFGQASRRQEVDKGVHQALQRTTEDPTCSLRSFTF